jgi:hypothetical protein
MIATQDKTPLYFRAFGKDVKVVAIATTDTEANDYCREHRDCGVLDNIEGNFIFIAKLEDLGEAKLKSLHPAEMFVEIVAENSPIIKGKRITVSREAMGGRHRVCRVWTGKKWTLFHGVIMLPASDFTEVKA